MLYNCYISGLSRLTLRCILPIFRPPALTSPDYIAPPYTMATAQVGFTLWSKTHSNINQNLSFVLEGIHKVKYEDRPLPELETPHDVIINVKFTGICGSDVCTHINKYRTQD